MENEYNLSYLKRVYSDIPNGINTEKDINLVLKRIVEIARKASTSFDEDLTSHFISASMCSNIGFDIAELNMPRYGKDSYEFAYYVSAISIKINKQVKKYIIDTNYEILFNKNDNEKICYELPGFYISKTLAGRDFANKLIENGFFECNETNMKLYCDSFVLSKFNYGKKYNKIVLETAITGDEYLKSVIDRKFFDKIKVKKR